jgi:hypothetical protein
MMNYTAAHEVALKKFRACPLEDISRCSGYSIAENSILVDFIGGRYKVEYPDGNFKPVVGSDSELPIFAQILVLHYLANLTDSTDVGTLISYKELPGGSIYINPFTHRAIDPLVRIFGAKPESLLEAAAHLGGKPNGLGDVGVTIRVFPRIPVTLVLWRADDEFPASGNILFDASAPLILPTEDFAVLASLVVGALKKLSA